MKMIKYLNRIIDTVLEQELKAFGAVLITGPKWCGKTTTAKRIANSVLYMQDPDRKSSYISLAELQPSLLLKGDNPRLIDEWQMAPQLWDAIRFDIDSRNKTELYILTGSSTIDEDKISHSGAGRISRIKMWTMSLYESLDSNGQVSLIDLFNAKHKIEGLSELEIKDIADLIVRG